MRRALFILISLLLPAGVAFAQGAPKRLVAVTGIDHGGGSAELLASVVEEFMVGEMRKDARFAQVLGPLDVADRASSEGLDPASCSDDACRIRAASLAGSDSVVLGALAPEGSNLVLRLKLVDTASGQVMDSAVHQVPLAQEETLLDALPPLLGRLFSAFDRNAPPMGAPQPTFAPPQPTFAPPQPQAPPPPPQQQAPPPQQTYAPPAQQWQPTYQPPPVAAPVDNSRPGFGHWGSTISWATGVLAGGAALGLFLAANEDFSTAEANAKVSSEIDVTYEQVTFYEDRANTFRTASFALVIASGALLTTGTLLAIFAEEWGSQPVKQPASQQPWSGGGVRWNAGVAPLPGGGGATVGLRW